LLGVSERAKKDIPAVIYRVSGADPQFIVPPTFEANMINIVGFSLPIVPLSLKGEVYSGLGWVDRVQMISNAVIRSRRLD
jgi:hypothetical protein